MLKTARQIVKKFPVLDLFIISLFSLPFFFWGLGETFLTNWDEAWYAGISRNMLLRHDYVVPYWNFSPYFDKGPFYHWLSVIAFKIFQNWELSARLPAALAGFGGVVLVYLLGKKLYDRKTAMISSLVLASTVGFLYRSRTGNLDSLSVFFILLSFLSFFLGVKNRRYFLLIGPSLGFLFLTKTGLVVYPILILLILFLWNRQLHLLKDSYLLTGVFIGFLVSLLWLYSGAKTAGQAFSSFYLNPLFWAFFKYGSLEGSTDRFSPKFIFFLFHGLKVWFLFFVPALIYLFSRILKDRRHFFLTVAFVPYFLVLLGTKEAGNWYLLPLYPITALIIGVSITFLQEKIFNNKIGGLALIIVVIALAFGQNIRYRSSFIVSQSVQAEVELSKLVQGLTKKDETIIVYDYYFPVASFYGERRIKVYRPDSEDTLLVISRGSLYKLLVAKEKVILLTTRDNLQKLNNDFKDINFEIKKQIGDHLLALSNRL